MYAFALFPASADDLMIQIIGLSCGEQKLHNLVKTHNKLTFL